MPLEKVQIHLILIQIASNMESKNINKIELAYLKMDKDILYFYFFGVPTLDLFDILPKKLKFNKISFLASYLQDFIYDCDVKVNTVNDCYKFFKTNTNYTIDDLDAELENNLYIGSHDNSEIHIKFPKDYNYKSIIIKLLRKYKFEPNAMIELLIQNENKYLEFETPNKLLHTYLRFDDYRNAMNDKNHNIL